MNILERVDDDTVRPQGACVRFESVDVEFPIYSSHGRSLKRSLVKFATGGRIALGARDRLVVEALRNVDFEAQHGDRIGLVGHNGAGKSTLLRAVAGVYEPIRGRVAVRGSVASLININLGLDMESTGYENIRMRCLLLGLARDENDELTRNIADTSELGEFLSMPVRTYSSGMVMRLGFAISTAREPDILLMDEWIGVGDSSFVGKAQDRLKRLVGRTGILFIASHNPKIIFETCNRALWLEKGEVKADGEPKAVINAYSDHYHSVGQNDESK